MLITEHFTISALNQTEIVKHIQYAFPETCEGWDFILQCISAPKIVQHYKSLSYHDTWLPGNPLPLLHMPISFL